jgi:hypothetical protein
VVEVDRLRRHVGILTGGACAFGHSVHLAPPLTASVRGQAPRLLMFRKPIEIWVPLLARPAVGAWRPLRTAGQAISGTQRGASPAAKLP